MFITKIKKHIAKKAKCDYKQVELSPNTKFGDLTIKCFGLGRNPDESAKNLANTIKPDKTIKSVNAIGPYLNFKINYKNFSKNVLQEIFKKQTKYGKSDFGKAEKIILEFAHPNTHKSFHIGHLRNIITGESLARILENTGYKIIRANYQGDVGLHIAKCLYGMENLKLKSKSEKQQLKTKNLNEKIEFLSKAYVNGSRAYEVNKKAKTEIQELNEKIYSQDKSVKKLYQQTRQWSLEYFNKIYKRLGVKFDRLYFESEVFKQGKKIVLKNLKNNIFKKSQNAIIFQGEKYGLHNRVFITSRKQATYEAKDLALAELQIKEYNPSKIIHLVGPEQTEYFKVVFKALEKINPKFKNKEIHLSYGWVGLKSGKMSSRAGKVVLAESLLDKIKTKLNNQEKIAQAAVKYSILKNSRTKDIAFSIKESINLSGNSGPYLQYTYARIQSILKKHGKELCKNTKFCVLTDTEQQLILQLSLFPEAILQSAKNFDSSEIAKYLYNLAKIFNDYYHKVPILKSKKIEKEFRLVLISVISIVLKKGLYLLGIETVDKM
tara:strand:- start:2237 stop:3883 length:1647 start_codon:yes stop_codon:yes gene_type:complete